jgi:hypothetical protein
MVLRCAQRTDPPGGGGGTSRQAYVRRRWAKALRALLPLSLPACPVVAFVLGAMPAPRQQLAPFMAL